MNPLDILLEVDQKIVDILESFCHWQQRWLGTSHYIWLRLFATIHAMLFFVFFMPWHDPVGLILSYVVIVLLLSYIPVSSWWEKTSIKRMQKGLANPMRKSSLAMVARYLIGYLGSGQVVFITTIVLLSNFSTWMWFLLVNLFWFSLAALFILPVCDPLPPSDSKLKEKIESFFLKAARS